jgi:hypothetical protein
VQQNAAMVEQAATAEKSREEQANELHAAVNVFRLTKPDAAGCFGGAAAPASPRAPMGTDFCPAPGYRESELKEQRWMA